VSTAHLPADAHQVALITLTQEKGEEYWLTRQNFYSITRYNHSRMYAMAVTQLAEAIRQKHKQ
ncbi:MAG: lytic murein transglycosylase B, partial [Piscirickettsiaceae bacterium]|nr:lytic murein transglycosylase B [Piscirickettsiaceae bacterium]